MFNSPIFGINKQNDVYYIETASDLFEFAQRVNNGETNANAILTHDIEIGDLKTYRNLVVLYHKRCDCVLNNWKLTSETVIHNGLNDAPDAFNDSYNYVTNLPSVYLLDSYDSQLGMREDVYQIPENMINNLNEIIRDMNIQT